VCISMCVCACVYACEQLLCRTKTRQLSSVFRRPLITYAFQNNTTHQRMDSWLPLPRPSFLPHHDLNLVPCTIQFYTVRHSCLTVSYPCHIIPTSTQVYHTHRGHGKVTPPRIPGILTVKFSKLYSHYTAAPV